jgi:small-conductance mechanosensitive channel
MVSDITYLATLEESVYVLPLVGKIPLGKILIAIGIFIGLNILFWLVRKVLLVRLRAWSRKTSTDIDDTIVAAIESIKSWVYSIVSIYAALHLFEWSPLVDKVFLGVLLSALLWQAIKIVYCFLNYGVLRYARKHSESGELDANASTMADLIRLLVGIALWTLGGLFILANLGINVTSLIAGLGIGGIAIAFALQGVLSDLFASFSLYFDRPFRIGDFIVIGQDSGTVEKIGVKSTRIRTLQGEELVVSNAELTTARVQNFKKMDERRIAMNIGIAYETPYEKVARLDKIIREAFAAFDGGRIDRVFFTTFGDSALIFEIVYFIESPEMIDYLQVQERFNLQLLKTFADEGINFAYPTRTIYTKAL